MELQYFNALFSVDLFFKIKIKEGLVREEFNFFFFITSTSIIGTVPFAVLLNKR